MRTEREIRLEEENVQLRRHVEVLRRQLRRHGYTPRPMRRRPRYRCGTGSSVPLCWGSTIYGPDGCTCP